MNDIQHQTARAIASVNNAARVVHSLAAPVATTVGVELPAPAVGQTVPEALTAFAQTLSDVADAFNEFSAQVVQAPARVIEGRLRPALEDRSQEIPTDPGHEVEVPRPIEVRLGTVLGEVAPEPATEDQPEAGANGQTPRRRRGRGQGSGGN